MTILNLNEALSTFLAQTLPQDVVCKVDVTISANQEQRDAKSGKKTTAHITFPKGWTLEKLIQRLCASNSPKVALQADFRGKVIPATIKWTCNEPGKKRARVITITQEQAMKAVLGEETYAMMLKKLGTVEAVYEAFQRFVGESTEEVEDDD